MKTRLFLGICLLLAGCKKDSTVSSVDFRLINSSSAAIQLHVKQVYIFHTGTWHALRTTDTLITVPQNQPLPGRLLVPAVDQPSENISQIRFELADTNYRQSGSQWVPIQSPTSNGNIFVQLPCNVRMKGDFGYHFSIDVNGAASIDTIQNYFTPFFSLTQVLEN